MGGAHSFLPDPFVDTPQRDPFRTYQPLSAAEMIALERAPKRRDTPGRPGEPIDLSRSRPGDVFITDRAEVRIAPDGRPLVKLKPGYENGRSAATAGPLFIPPGPNDASVDANIEETRRHWPLWFLGQVPNGHAWDYKHTGGPQYEAFGNFNYGAVGAGHLPDYVLERGAGWYQQRRGTSDPKFGSPILGTGSYGDDPIDQFWIQQGIRYYDEPR